MDENQDNGQVEVENQDVKQEIKQEVKQVEKKDKNGGKDEKPNIFTRAWLGLKSFANELSGEFKKIIWPTLPELRKQTITVIITGVIIGAIICGFDVIFNFAHTQLLNLLT